MRARDSQSPSQTGALRGNFDALIQVGASKFPSRQWTRPDGLGLLIPASAATTAAAAAEAAALRALLRFVHFQGASVQHRAVELRDRGGCRRRASHGDECEAAGLAAFSVRRNGDFTNLTGDGK